MTKYKFKLLIVEDEFLIAWDIKELLEEFDFSVHIVKDYLSAINYIGNNKTELVIIDVYLGAGNSGIVLAKQLLHEHNIPFIYLTSYNDANTLEEIIKTRPYGFITKPFKKIDLLTTVQIVINSYYYDKLGLINFKNNFDAEASYLIKKVLNFIDANIENKIEIDDLVALTKWSKHHFVRMFTSQMNISPYNYVLKIKIEHAKIMILKKNTKLESIAFDLGFQSYVNFARTFKNYTKFSPKEFRDKNSYDRSLKLPDSK
jgi:YesN/AraC family two-component response regulator